MHTTPLHHSVDVVSFVALFAAVNWQNTITLVGGILGALWFAMNCYSWIVNKGWRPHK